MLVATRDHEPRADALHFHAAATPRSLVSRFSSGVQLIGSLVGIPLALIGGYSTYHANFSPEAKCQALRANIVTMLDKKADASTLRLLVRRDVVTFERDCGAVDADAAAAFKTLLAAEKSPVRLATPSAKAETAVAERPARAEKRDTAKHETPAKETVAKLEPPKKSQPVTPSRVEVEKAIDEAKPPAATAAQSETVDAAWVASVREALRESAARPPAIGALPEPAVAPMPEPITVLGEPQPSGNIARVRTDALVPPADVGPPPPRPVHPVPPAPIPSAD